MEFEKNIVIFEISTLDLIKIDFLTNVVNLGIGCVFSKRPGSTFSEYPGAGAGPGTLCKVCSFRVMF